MRMHYRKRKSVGTSPIFERRYVHSDLDSSGPTEVALASDDTVEQFASDPEEDLGESLDDDRRVDLVELEDLEGGSEEGGDGSGCGSGEEVGGGSVVGDVADGAE